MYSDIKNIEYETDQYINIFETEDGFGFCLSGTTKDGLLWETDDYTGFDSIESAESAAYDHLKAV